MISAEAPTLAMLRLANRLTSLELARRLGIAVTAITAWEAGRAYPSPRQQHAPRALPRAGGHSGCRP
jgi:transcriptional regulator with XRE-family HTH domain